MEIDPVYLYPVYLYNYESKNIANLIRSNKLSGSVPCMMMVNLLRVFLPIFSTELQLKVEHSGSHATFLDLYTSMDKGKLIC